MTLSEPIVTPPAKDTHPTVQLPKAKFKLGDIVIKTTNSRQGLRLYQPPHYCHERHTYLYPYEYGLGGTSEGWALESQLRLAPPGTTI